MTTCQFWQNSYHIVFFVVLSMILRIDLDTGLLPNVWQYIIQTNVDQILWWMYTSLRPKSTTEPHITLCSVNYLNILTSLWECSSNYHLKSCCWHYDDVRMGAIASQITSLTIVYSTVYSGADQCKHQSSASLAFVWWIHWGPVNSPHKWPVARKIFPFDDVIMDISGRRDIR